MSKSLKNYTTIRSVLSEKEWTARSLRICFLLMPWQDGIEVTDELMKAVVGWEGKLNSFFRKSLDLLNNPSAPTSAAHEPSTSDQQLLSALDKAKFDVDMALCNSLNTSAVMKILSDLVTECNSAEVASDQTVLQIARWTTRIVTIFGLNPKGNLGNQDAIGWSGLDIPALARPYVLPMSQLRDKIRSMARSGSIDHTAMTELAASLKIAASPSMAESSKPYEQVLQQFRGDVKALAAQEAPAKDLLALFDQLRDVHLWNLGIYLEDRSDTKPALVRPLDKLLIEARAEQESAKIAKARAKLEQQAKEAEREKELGERAKVSPLLMFRDSDEYREWDESGIPIVDAAGNTISKSKHKKLVKEWEKQKKMHEEWRATQRIA